MGRNSIKKLRKPPRYNRGSAIVHLVDEPDLFRLLESTENPFVLVLDGVQDPHNLGACLRTCSGAGVTAVIAPKKGACGITDTVRDISCGGTEDVPFLQVRNLSQTLRNLQEMGIRLVATADEAEESLYEVDLTGPVGIILGSEGWGVRKKIADNSDHRVSIPMQGSVDCLNVSVSTGVCLYEAVRQRLT
ncbi:23S rRNA (guanosine(2251)-2'-O)-methyltransferase RlmB [Puniceicoccus vermicola]|uniref:23S rRNA (Guanosine(2251)-2'-O)-methyltransferase RlmB n=1 Tax=Puniceicoccus vermicola TaxID=388746 RepID=A0A7X1AYN3_9BACT|nr:23S rRNA (guanosine(2251)-2'-O)-methyltransferase RlmB [Puniceicoccus vermicola]MBC2602401.1 23S rRNA (guanosine(2251)-2'-O)-methyltransferase RlmB [Puniceicoccus vermicola]